MILTDLKGKICFIQKDGWIAEPNCQSCLVKNENQIFKKKTEHVKMRTDNNDWFLITVICFGLVGSESVERRDFNIKFLKKYIKNT